MMLPWQERALTGMDGDCQDKAEEINYSASDAFIFHPAFSSYGRLQSKERT
jgi:hypothetical protein